MPGGQSSNESISHAILHSFVHLLLFLYLSRPVGNLCIPNNRVNKSSTVKMMTSTYDSLPSRFDWNSYYQQQASGFPQFPVFRARQRGGFLVPLLRSHGIPLLKWLGKQAASLATSAGSEYLNKGSLSKQDVKGLLKKQGKVAAHSVLDRLKQQLGAGMMNHRRDMRLHSLLSPTAQQDGLLTNVHKVRGPGLFPASRIAAIKKRRSKGSKKSKAVTSRSKPKKRKSTAKRKQPKAKSKKTNKKKQAKKIPISTRKRAKKAFNHTIFS